MKPICLGEGEKSNQFNLLTKDSPKRKEYWKVRNNVLQKLKGKLHGWASTLGQTNNKAGITKIIPKNPR